MKGLICPKNTHSVVPKATSRSVNKSIVVAVILTAIIVGSVVGVAVYAYFALQPAPAQQLVSQPKPAPRLEKFKAAGYTWNCDICFLVADAGKDRRIYANNGLDPEWVVPPPGRPPFVAADIKEQVAFGIKIGVQVPAEIPLARSAGVPVKIVAGY